MWQFVDKEDEEKAIFFDKKTWFDEIEWHWIIGSVKADNNPTAQICPVCRGTGNVPGGFYNSTGETCVSDRVFDKCRACGGKGYIVV